MTDPLYELQRDAEKDGAKVTNDKELQELRDQVFKLQYNGSLNPIPNNPHSAKTELAKDKDFVKKLDEIVTDFT